MASFNKKDITSYRLFTESDIYLISGFRTNGYHVILEEDKNQIEKQYEKILKDKLVIWGMNYLHTALRFNFICTEVIVYSNKCQIYKLERNYNNRNDIKVIDAVEEYLLSLERISIHECSRNTIYGLKQYSNIVVHLNYISGFEFFPDYSTCCIYSPFSKEGQVDKLLEELKDKEESEMKEYLRKNLSQYITPYMIEVIKKYNIHENITEDQIKDEYILLIFDFINVKKKSVRRKH